jgi:uncharacterized membrane protein
MNIQAFLDASGVIQAHALAALIALAIGAALLLAPKGTIPHRTFGVVFLTLMVAVAVTAVFIREINDGAFSPIHIFVPLTLVTAVMGYIRARRGDRRGHRNAMLMLFFGALLIPGAFTLIPGRLMHTVVFG